MRSFLFILFLLACKVLSAQRLLHLQQNATGSLNVNIHPKTNINPCNPIFSSYYGYYSSPAPCGDSLYYKLQFHSPRFGNQEEVKHEPNCFELIDFSYAYLIDNADWVNNRDLYPLLRVVSDFMMWQDKGNGKWEFTSSDHRYVCGNDKTGHTVSDHQIWQLNDQHQVKTVYQLNSSTKTEHRYDFTYTAFGKIQSASERDYDHYDSTKYTDYQREWFYDTKQRDAMMISYAGRRKKFSDKKISQFKQLLKEELQEGETELRDLLDSNEVKELLVYNYGKFGLEQVNCYYNPEDYSNEIEFYSDSLFYNKSGKIVRYVSGNSLKGKTCELRYTYDLESGKLSQVNGRNYSECANRGCNEDKVEQWFTYKDNKVDTLKEKIYEIRYHYKDGKYANPTDELQEERIYAYKYKLGKK